MRRLVHSALLVAVSAFPALAQPVIVIPGRPDVPIFENGVDISWSVVEGEFGLDRPGLVTPTVIYRPPPVIVPYYGAAANEPGYYPRSDRQPGYGRLEIVPGPNRPLPPPAQSYRRSWSSTSAPTPADLPSPYPPTVIDPIISPVIGPSFNGPPRNHRPWASGRPGHPGRPPGGQPPGGQPPGGGPPPGGQSFNGPPPNLPPGGHPPGPGPQ
jgi:hypothetical protein